MKGVEKHQEPISYRDYLALGIKKESNFSRLKRVVYGDFVSQPVSVTHACDTRKQLW